MFEYPSGLVPSCMLTEDYTYLRSREVRQGPGVQGSERTRSPGDPETRTPPQVHPRALVRPILSLNHCEDRPRPQCRTES